MTKKVLDIPYSRITHDQFVFTNSLDKFLQMLNEDLDYIEGFSVIPDKIMISFKYCHVDKDGYEKWYGQYIIVDAQDLKENPEKYYAISHEMADNVRDNLTYELTGSGIPPTNIEDI